VLAGILERAHGGHEHDSLEATRRGLCHQTPTGVRGPSRRRSSHATAAHHSSGGAKFADSAWPLVRGSRAMGRPSGSTPLALERGAAQHTRAS
jgi:hypothetical protein